MTRPRSRVVAESFSWPFRGDWKSRWMPGLLCLLLLPLAFILLLGYAIAATRAAEVDAAAGPPKWAVSSRLLSDGFWTSIALVVLTAPFVLLINPFAGLLFGAHLWHLADVPLSQLYAHVVAAFSLALPWGLLLLLHMPHATARFAHSLEAKDLFDLPAAIRDVRRDFATWNVAAAAIVTAWGVG